MSVPWNVTVSCQTDKSGPSKPRGRKQHRSSAAVIAEFIEKCDQEDIQKMYDDFDDSSDDEEDIYENIKLQKGVIESVRFQPWRMAKKFRLISFAKSYVEKHEGQLSRGRGYQEKGARAWRQFRRLVYRHDGFSDTLGGEGESDRNYRGHFGTVVASYFLFLRWLIWINVCLMLLQVCFVIVPELIVGNAHGSLGRKSVPVSELETSQDLETIWDAEGIVKYSAMFYGYYGSERVIGRGYRLPLAYLVTGFTTFAISFIVVLRKMASNSRLSRLSNEDEQFTFSWRLFCSWDFTIGNTETANTKTASIVTTFREAILEEKEKEKDVNKYRLMVLRVLANVCVLLMLGASTYAIQLCVERSRQLDIRKRRGQVVTGFWQENELTLVMTIISTIFPNIFDLFAVLEKYHPRVTLRWQLARIFALNLLNLYTLFIALFWKQQDMKKELEEKLINSTSCEQTTSILPVNITTQSTVFVNNFTSPLSTVDATLCSGTVSEEMAADLCWETMIGQEVVKLTLMDLIVVVGQIIVQDFIRGLFVRYCNAMCCWDMEKQFPEYADFKTAENLLHLVNNQGVVWLGLFFAPGLAVLNLLKLLVLVYVRSWSVMVCNVPQEAIFRSSRSNNFYYALLLVMLFLTMLPPLFAIVALVPSPHCGPFSGQQQILRTLTDTIEQDLPSVAGVILAYTSSPVVILPLFLLFGMLIYYLTVVSQSLRDANKQLRVALEYERTEGKRKIYAMADATWALKSGGQSTNNTREAGGRGGPKMGPKRKQRGLGDAAMSMLAATRVAKILSAGPKSKIGPSSTGPALKPPKRWNTGTGSSKIPKAEEKKMGSLLTISGSMEDSSRPERRKTTTDVVKTTRPRTASEEAKPTKAQNAARRKTQVAIVQATQKFRKATWKDSKEISERPHTTRVLQINDIVPIMEEEAPETRTTEYAHDDTIDAAPEEDTETNVIQRRYKFGLLKSRKPLLKPEVTIRRKQTHNKYQESPPYNELTRRHATPDRLDLRESNTTSEPTDLSGRHYDDTPHSRLDASVVVHSRNTDPAYCDY
ncbi:transmembrane channel-like protein 3 [Pecten maximus]|uniref:transmembrane channel-like protein 3 n=1 Tax=Pecten maximus TaxID=6579 RepID=UPI00145872A1|nr:transmembrane channel-like protein 3 [Pecten maximus]